ncbi:MAG TPA: hypothetical protein VF928_06375, partial [Usitatibacteraceae bacterium]
SAANTAGDGKTRVEHTATAARNSSRSTSAHTDASVTGTGSAQMNTRRAGDLSTQQRAAAKGNAETESVAR